MNHLLYFSEIVNLTWCYTGGLTGSTPFTNKSRDYRSEFRFPLPSLHLIKQNTKQHQVVPLQQETECPVKWIWKIWFGCHINMKSSVCRKFVLVNTIYKEILNTNRRLWRIYDLNNCILLDFILLQRVFKICHNNKCIRERERELCFCPKQMIIRKQQ